ncbi:MAG: hypothetical protein ACYTGP_08825 [Planctomycetota bacterium]|jgi:hypothetical protein
MNHRSAALVATVALSATPALAQWPNDPAAPLEIGEADTTVELRHAVAADGGTWMAWIDGLCFGELRVQRLTPSGAALVPGGLLLPDVEPLCGVTHVMLYVMPDSSAIVQGGATGTDRPLHRIASDGTPLWGPGLLITDWIGGLEGFLALDGGDVMLAGYQGMSIFVTRRALDGTEVWTTEIPTMMSSNRRIIGLVPDGAGGAFIVWDSPLSYTRLVAALHVNAAGVSTWTDPLIVVPADPSSSRHTDPVVLSDGRGGAVLVFAKGTETASTPVPLLMQRFDVTGTLAFDVQGVRVSLDTDRQFDPIVTRDAATDDLMIVWRSGLFADQDVRAQRLTVDGARLWGPTGVTIADLGEQGTGFFDASWDGTTLSAAVSRPEPDAPSVHVHRVDGAGTVDPVALAVSGVTESGTVAADSLGADLTLSWFELESGFNGDVFAQRLNADGTLGVNVADLDGDGDVDFADLLLVIAGWGPCPDTCPADLNGDGAVGFADVLIVIANWS